MQVAAYAAEHASAPLRRTTITRREVGPRDVLIEIKYSGICHSDIHVVHEHWGSENFPIVPGHEIVGLVAAVGSEVARHRVGERVGVGCMVNSCRECENCLAGEQQHCLNGAVSTYGGRDRDGSITQGGYSTHVVVDEDFVLRIPDSLDLPGAAPLLCAGVTTYSPLKHWKVGPGTKVAVIGLGGLGHMAVQIAAALGAEVSVLSQSLNKQEDGLALGAKHYYATNDPATFETLRDRFDFILNTVSVPLDLDQYLRLLRLDGTLVVLGAPPEPLQVNAFSLLNRRRRLAGSTIGGIPETQEALDFCAAHNISSRVEVIDASAINEAWKRVLDSDVRYRFVIDTATLN